MAEGVTLGPVVLFSMVIPLTIGGWGVREATAGTVWALAGLPESEGVAASVTYGLLVLVSALPGLMVLLGGLGKNNIGEQR